MTSRNRYTKAIEQAAGDALPVPDASEVYQTTMPPIPRKRDRGYRFSNDGLIIQRPLTRDEFREGLLPEIEAMQSRYQLIVGDAANHGLDNGLIDSYEDMALLTGYTAGSIEVYASICRNIPQLTRVNSLKFKHYQVIARLDEDERPHWIHFAATYGLGYRVIESMIAEIDARLPGLPAIADEPPLPHAPALSDENEEATSLFDDYDVTDPVHEKRFIGFRKRAAQNRYAEIDMIEIDEAEKWLAFLRKKVAQAKVEADRQARMRKK